MESSPITRGQVMRGRNKLAQLNRERIRNYYTRNLKEAPDFSLPNIISNNSIAPSITDFDRDVEAG